MQYIYLNSDFFNKLSKDELGALMQAVRISNGVLRRVKRVDAFGELDKNNFVQLFDMLDIHIEIAGYVRESWKVIYYDVCALLSGMITKHCPAQLEQFTINIRRYENYKKDINLSFVKYIRDEFGYHLGSGIYDDFYIDGIMLEDRKFGFITGDNRPEITFIDPEIAIINKIRNHPLVCGDKFPITKAFNIILEEAINLSGSIAKITRAITEGHGYIKES